MVKKPMKAAGPLIFAAAIAAAVLISVSGIRCYAVLTGSMEPVLPVGSLLVVVPMSFDELKVGQDITYNSGRHGNAQNRRHRPGGSDGHDAGTDKQRGRYTCHGGEHRWEGAVVPALDGISGQNSE